MSLRYRLFLWISGLFVVVAIFSYCLENYITSRALAKAQKNLREKLLDIGEQRRLDIQSFLASSIAENEVRIDAVLNNISTFSPQVLRFGPTLNNEKKGTWGEVADLLFDYKWIDFLQNTNEGMSTATIIPGQPAIEPAYRIDIDSDLSWIYLNDFKKYPDPFFAVKIPYIAVHPIQGSASEIVEQVPGIIPAAFLLFDVKELLSAPISVDSPPILQATDDKIWPSIPVKWTEGYELEINSLVKAFRRGRSWLLSKKIQPPQLQESEVVAKIDYGLNISHLLDKSRNEYLKM